MNNLKYVPPSTRKPDTDPNHGCPINPSRWKSGPDLVSHEQYYAWLKHRAQANFRKEEYSLTWEEWTDLWGNGKWEQRGRGRDDLCLMQLDRAAGWHKHNVEVVPRVEYLKRMGEYRALKNG